MRYSKCFHSTILLVIALLISINMVLCEFGSLKGITLPDPPLNLHSIPCDPPRFSDHDICTTDKFYIYDHFPADLVDLWPKKDGELRKHYRKNYGTGEIFNASLGMHETHQFTVFTPIYERLLHDYRY